MAILPRTLLTQPAPAAVAAVSLLGFTILGMAAEESVQRERLYQSYAAPCAELQSELGPQQIWGELDYARYATCFADNHDPQGAVAVAREGLERNPTSQILFNLKGYNEIEIGEFEAAAATLEEGIREVPNLSNGVMENNLAWAYLWTGDGGTEGARALVQASLAREPYVCEALHTGLFVEFEIARKTTGIEQAEAWRSFQSLRTRYQDCENRDSSWGVAVESAGAGVLFAESERLMGTAWDQQGLGLTLQVTAATLLRNHKSASLAALCRDAMPLADLRGQCVDEVEAALSVTRARNHR